MERRKFLKFLGLGSLAAFVPSGLEAVPSEESWSPLEFARSIEVERSILLNSNYYDVMDVKFKQIWDEEYTNVPELVDRFYKCDAKSS